MLKQSPSRNQRLKNFKVKHAVQICVMLVISMWLLYQVKLYYDRKLALRQITDKEQHQVMKLGRKGLNPELEEIAAQFEKRGDEEEDEVEQEDDDEGKVKVKETEGEEAEGIGDDGNDQVKLEEEESEPVEDLIDEEDKEGM